MDLQTSHNAEDDQGNFRMYQNPGYRNDRTEKQVLTILLDNSPDSQTINLYEPMKLDGLTDIYLDSVVTGEAATVTGNDKNMFFLKVNEFNIQSNSGASTSTTTGSLSAAGAFNSILIPNTRITASKTHSHRVNKFNFVSTINPTTLTTLNVQFAFLTDLGVASVTPGDVAWITFMFVRRAS
jgi:hypothetical protein